MKKPFLFFAMLLLGAAGLLRAQETVLFSDDFESGNLNNWTLIDADGDGNNWSNIISTYTNAFAHSGDHVAASISWNADVTYTPDNYMVSPLVEGAFKINYFVVVNVDFPDHYGIAVSSTGTDPSDFTMVFDELVLYGSSGGWFEKEVELPVGTKYVAFRHYNSDDNNFLLIDDVVITEKTPANVISTANWYAVMSGMGFSNCFYSFGLHQLLQTEVASGEMNGHAGSYANGYYWGVLYGAGGTRSLYKAPVDNSNKTIGEPQVIVEDFSNSIQCMSFNPDDGMMYFVDIVRPFENQFIPRLGRFNLSDPAGSQTIISELDFNPQGFAINRNGDAYCLKDGADLYLMNLTNGSTMLVGSTGCSESNYHCLAFDLETNELIWAMNRSIMMQMIPVSFYIVDTETGAAQHIGDMDGCFSVDYLFSVPNDEGVAEVQGEGIALWPNPTGNTLFLEDADDETVSVYDLNGRLVLQVRYNGSLHVGSLAPGIYMVAVKDRKMRFVKE